MKSHVVERFDDTAVNCLTGSYARLARKRGRPVDEQSVFEHGNGYLFQAGLDEAGYPEYVFPVDETATEGMRNCGFAVHRVPIDPADIAGQLAQLTEAYEGVVVWVNTAHLSYADVYRDNVPYLHAVVVEAVAEDRATVDVLDCLVVDLKPFSCRARLSVTDLERAVSDRIRSEAHDGMGYFCAITDERPPSGAAGAVPDLGSALFRQAGRFTAEERFHSAIRRYQRLCEECFTDTPPRAAHAARRLFHHSTVLYAAPALTLMERSLRAAGAPERTLQLHEAALRDWQAMGVLALRFEATAAPSVLRRINDRFAALDQTTTALWESIAAW
ncbi:hypothetical protein B1R27_27040 [Streptomyces sp. GKU 895]|nr:hypothetical protein B1R27_27040 [Streptomyces sp. GKU 895]